MSDDVLVQLHTLHHSIICCKMSVLGRTIYFHEPASCFGVAYRSPVLGTASIMRSRAFEHGRTSIGPQGRAVFHFFEIEQATR